MRAFVDIAMQADQMKLDGIDFEPQQLKSLLMNFGVDGVTF